MGEGTVDGFFGTFRLERAEDVSGVSGTGHVADGTEFPDGTVAVRWRGVHPTTALHRDMASVEFIHLHGGKTRLVWLWRMCEACMTRIASPEEREQHAAGNHTKGGQA